MPGTVKIWWHDGAVKDVRHHGIPVVNEPELGFQSLAISTSPANSTAAPANAVMALIEADVNIRYVVRRPGETTVASSSSKPITATGPATDVIGVAPGHSISFIEA